MAKLSRSLGLPALSFYGVGMILGAGIYSVIGAAAGKAGEGLWLSFLVSSIVVFLTALAYAELATLFPEAGAEFIYLRKAFPKHKRIAFVTSFLIALSGAATTATVSIAFAGYLGHFITLPAGLVSISVVLIVGSIAILGIQESSWVNIIFTLIEGSGLLLVIYFGIQEPRFGDVIGKAPHWGVLSGSALVFFSFLGFENIANLAEEAKSPHQALPKAIFVSIAIATVLYVLIALSSVALISIEDLSGSASPLADALGAKSKKLAGALSAIALFATANTALISLIATSRILFSIARQKELPAFFAKTSARRKTPWAATLLAFLMVASFLPLGKVSITASVSSLASLLAFTSVNIALLRLRWKSSAKRSFRVGPNIGRVPIPTVIAILSLLLFLGQFELKVYGIGAAAIALISGAHALRAYLK